MRELPPAATHLPDSLVGFFPFGFEELEERGLQAPVEFTALDPRVVGAIHRVEHFAVDVELKLLRGGVAHSYRPRILVAAQPFNLEFLEATFTAHAIHDLHLLGTSGDRAQEPFP